MESNNLDRTVELLKSLGAKIQADGSYKRTSDYAFDAYFAGSTLTITTARGVHRYSVNEPFSADPCVDPNVTPDTWEDIHFEISHALDPQLTAAYDGINPHFHSNPLVN